MTSGYDRLRSRARRRVLMRRGLPAAAVAILAIAGIVAILATNNTRTFRAVKGYAEFTVAGTSCSVDRARRLNVTGCSRVRPDVYALRFNVSLRNTTAVATRGICCPGFVTASVVDDRTVLVDLPPRSRAPIRAAVLVP